MERIDLLLRQAGDQVRQDKAHLAASGEAFNIFSITKIERAEVNTHSAMIAELLNPRGSHGQGSTFLALFLSVMKFEHDCSLSNANVRKEQSFPGARGRVDIVIHLKEHLILIENKIDAQDGNEQLKQYADIGQASGKTWHLWYLSKRGVDADERSHRGVEYQRLSYSAHILEWLELCVSNSSSMPALQQAILQYKRLVNKITGTTMTHISRAAMVDLLNTGENLKAADAIVAALPFAKGAELYRFFGDVERALLRSFRRAAAPTNFPGYDFDESTCSKWFMPKEDRVEHVGLFLDIGIDGVLFRIEVATDALHYGVISVRDGKMGSIDGIRESVRDLPGNLLSRQWRSFKWLSCMFLDNVATNMEWLLKPEEVVAEILHTIEQIKLRNLANVDA
ncbi:PD-(D/E)XK nuclease family protein [Pseudomonas sp. NPDC089569]|uniref:PDDEXK-like family protein n=1 Tax=Pseudomonas sp. NPDC089569 TaxID=3390722 RepID=UPI003D00BCEC